MKAAIVRGYGVPDGVTVGEAPKPTPQAGEVLIRVHAATVNRTDCGELAPHPAIGRLVFGLRRPRRSILGMDFAGEVESLGAGVTAFKRGDRVFGMCPSTVNGPQAEFVCLPETGSLAQAPAGLRLDEAVVCEGAFYANAGLRRLGLRPGHAILIYGASGAIGSAAVQLAKHYGAQVTAVVATRHLDLVKSLGADRVVDYTTDEFRRLDTRFDFVMDAVGKLTAFHWRRLLKPEGVFAATDIGPGGQTLRLWLWAQIRKSGRVVIALPERGSGRTFVQFLKGLMESGEFRGLFDRRYPLDEIREAYRYVETGQKTGIVVIDVAAPTGV